MGSSWLIAEGVKKSLISVFSSAGCFSGVRGKSVGSGGPGCDASPILVPESGERLNGRIELQEFVVGLYCHFVFVAHEVLMVKGSFRGIFLFSELPWSDVSAWARFGGEVMNMGRRKDGWSHALGCFFRVAGLMMHGFLFLKRVLFGKKITRDFG